MSTEPEQFFDKLSEKVSYSIPTSTEDLFTKDGLYKVYDVNKSTVEEVYPIIYNPNTIDVYCPECKKISTFSSDKKEVADILKRVNPVQWLGELPFYQASGLERKLMCSRNENHVIRIIFLVTKSGAMQYRLTKIGQHPSIADLSKYEIEEFKKILSDHYKEYNTALGLFSHGVGVGAFAYLRRVLENFVIKPAIQKSIDLSKHAEKDFDGMRTKDRVKMVKDELPEFLVKNTELYSILSRGLHETTDEECLEMFPIMHEAMLLILEEIKAKQDVEKRRQHLSQSIKNLSKEDGKNS